MLDHVLSPHQLVYIYIYINNDIFHDFPALPLFSMNKACFRTKSKILDNFSAEL